MRFKKFCFENKDYFKDSPEGDFIEDMERDGRFPSYKEKNKLLNYLKNKNACAEAIEAFNSLYNYYEKEDVTPYNERPPYSKKTNS
jgi:hypothetical protein